MLRHAARVLPLYLHQYREELSAHRGCCKGGRGAGHNLAIQYGCMLAALAESACPERARRTAGRPAAPGPRSAGCRGSAAA